MFNNWQKDYQAYERQTWLDHEQNIARINKETFERKLKNVFENSANDEKEVTNYGA